MKEKKPFRHSWTKMKPVLVIALAVGFCLSILYRFYGNGEAKEKIEIMTSLEDVIDISELSTARFTYNGIAQAYKDEEKTKVKCNIRYEAEVNAAIDISKVSFETDEEAKVVKVKLPKIKLNSYINSDSSISFIPSDVKMELKDAIEICEMDALEEASSSDELLNAAEDNLKGTVEALLLPILEENELTIVWE